MRIPCLGMAGGVVMRLREWVMGSRENSDAAPMVLYDRTLLWLTFGPAIIGFVMVTSASMPVGQRLSDDPFLRQARRILSAAGFWHGDGHAARADGSMAALQQCDASGISCDAADRTGGGQLG